MLKLENSIRGLSFSRVAFDLTIQANRKKNALCNLFFYNIDLNISGHHCFVFIIWRAFDLSDNISH